MDCEIGPTTKTATEQELYPAVASAYEFVMPSYQMLASRFEAADARIATALNLASTLTLAAPVLAQSIRPGVSFTSCWFLAAMAVFIVAIAAGMAGRLRGSLTLPDPMAWYKTSLHESEWAFKKNAIFFAGQHFSKNADAVRVKGNVSFIVGGLLACEVILLVLWIVR